MKEDIEKEEKVSVNEKEIKKDKLVSGEVGWISASIKDISKVHVGDVWKKSKNLLKKIRS